MNLKGVIRFLTLILFSVVIGLAVQAIIRRVWPDAFAPVSPPAQTLPQTAQTFATTVQEERQRPPQTTVHFAPRDAQQSLAVPVVTEVKTDYGTLYFSTRGGALDRFDYRPAGRAEADIITPLRSSDKAQEYSFLIALEEQTPLTYTLTEKKDEGDATLLTYHATGPTASIIKKFSIDRKVPRITLELTVEPHGKKSVRPRLFLPAPFVAQTDQGQQVSGFVYEHQKIKRLKIDEQLANQFWFSSTLPAGAEDRYFINALVGDPDGFTRRAYFTGKTGDTLHVIFEGPEITEKKTLTLSFYCGPKDDTMLSAVDPRLEQALDYGVWSPLVKLILKILKLIYKHLKNYGVAILLLTLLIRILLIPVTWRGHKALEKQKEFQRKMRYIEQKYKNDPDALNLERAELTKKYGLSSMAGCLPHLLALPIFLALNRLLSTSIELYQAPFFGWITDLSTRDPYYILPFVSGVGMLVQMLSDTDVKKGVSTFLMVTVFSVITSYFPAGVVLYLLANTWLSIAQVYIQRKLGA